MEQGKMKCLDFSRYALSACAGVAILAACSGSQPPIGAPDAVPQAAPTTARPDRGKSWMLPSPKDDTLLYATNPEQHALSIYDYQSGVLLRSARVSHLEEECSDSSGNVYVASQGSGRGEILEYAHGSKTPVRRLYDPQAGPYSCAVDPTTGNLAITGNRGGIYGHGNVAVYEHARGRPAIYRDRYIYSYLFCTYDDKGNLFVEGLTGPNSSGWSALFAELPKGKTRLKKIIMQATINNLAGFQWDGKYLVIGGNTNTDNMGTYIYRMAVSGSTGTIEDTVELKGFDISGQFALQHDQIISPLQNGSQIGIWGYPSGGDAKRIIQTQHEGLLGTALSRP
jgi:hypothetical protein